MIRWFNIKTGKRFWYSIKITYIKDAKEIFYFTSDIGIASKRDILDHRGIGKQFHHRITHKSTKNRLCNGNLQITILCYLGWFKWKK